ncbi:MAG: hypothetical protein WBE48_16135, partial [Xanthobacteraceae bacterium]
MVAIQRVMIRELVDAGCRHVHMDAPGFTAYVDKVSLERMRARGDDPDESRSGDPGRKCRDRRFS